ASRAFDAGSRAPVTGFVIFMNFASHLPRARSYAPARDPGARAGAGARARPQNPEPPMVKRNKPTTPPRMPVIQPPAPPPAPPPPPLHRGLRPSAARSAVSARTAGGQRTSQPVAVPPPHTPSER